MIETQFKTGDKILIPTTVLKFNSQHLVRRLRYSSGPEENVSVFKLKDALIVERDGKFFPTPGDLVRYITQHPHPGTGIVTSIKNGKLIHKECDEYSYSSIKRGGMDCGNVGDYEVIGRNGELLPEKPVKDKKTELLRQGIKLIETFASKNYTKETISLLEYYKWLKKVEKELEGDEDV